MTVTETAECLAMCGDVKFDCCLLGCDTVQSGRKKPKFGRIAQSIFRVESVSNIPPKLW
jgi:hypothetical protein